MCWFLPPVSSSYWAGLRILDPVLWSLTSAVPAQLQAATWCYYASPSLHLNVAQYSLACLQAMLSRDWVLDVTIKESISHAFNMFNYPIQTNKLIKNLYKIMHFITRLCWDASSISKVWICLRRSFISIWAPCNASVFWATCTWTSEIWGEIWRKFNIMFYVSRISFILWTSGFYLKSNYTWFSCHILSSSAFLRACFS